MPDQTTLAPLSIRLFGPVRIRVGEAGIDVDTRKAIALLAYLAVEDGSHSRDALTGLLWPESEPTRARAALRRTLSVLRRAIGPRLHAERETVELERAHLALDVDEFRSALAERQAHSHAPAEVCDRCLPPLLRAVDAAGPGRFMEGFTLRDSDPFAEWQRQQEERLRSELSGVLVRLVQGYSERGDHVRAMAYAQRWVGLEPMLEPAHRALMSLYAVTGDRAAAIRQYRECVRILQEELGVAPLRQTSDLYHSIVGREPATTALPAPRAKPRARRADGAGGGGPLRLAFVGRGAERAALRSAFDAAGPGGCLAVLEGEAGVGKTRLVEELIAEMQPAPVLVARCYEGEAGLAYAPVTSLLRQLVADAKIRDRLAALPGPVLAEVSRLLPEIARLGPATATPPALDSPGAQIRLFECVGEVVRETLAAGRPGLLWVEDAHWADAASVQLLSFLVRRLASSPSLVIMTWRGEDLASAHPFRRLLATREREGDATRIALGRLDRDDVSDLLTRSAGTTARVGDLAQGLYEETEGLPLFVEQYVASLGDLMEPPGATPKSWPIPGDVRELLRQRLQQAREPGRQLLSTAAVIGRSFAFDILREASGRAEEEVLDTLDELVTSGLLRQRVDVGDEPTYEFSHDKLRVLAYEETSLARRRLLHRRVAEALERHATTTRALASLAGEVALHYQRAGQDERAATAFRMAGNRARAVYANAEAMAHYRAALALGDEPSAALHLAIGELQTLEGDYRAALASYEMATAYAEEAELPLINHSIGNLYRRLGQWHLADQHYGAAAEALEAEESSHVPAGPPAKLARIYADWSLSRHRQEKKAQARQLARHSLTLAEAARDVLARAEAHNILGILARAEGDLAKAEQQLRESLELAETSDAVAPRIAALNNLALALLARGKVEEAESRARRALELCEKLGDHHRAAALHSNLADILHAGADVDASMAHLKQAAGLFAEIGQGWGEMEPEIWKLTEW